MLAQLNKAGLGEKVNSWLGKGPNQPLTADEIRRVEALVNHEILSNVATEANLMTYDEAVSSGAMALFGEKYGDQVRVLGIGSSRELCGGTHVARTGDIGLFKIVSEGGVAAGIRRVEAITGRNALAWVQRTCDTLDRAAGLLKTQPAEVPERIQALQQQTQSGEGGQAPVDAAADEGSGEA